MSQRSEKLRRRMEQIEARMDDAETGDALRADRLRRLESDFARQRRADSGGKLNEVLACVLAGLTAATILVACARAAELKETDPVAEDPAPVIHAVAEMPELNENELIEAALLAKATKIDGVTVSHYCLCKRCCGKSPNHPAYGITRSGVRATPGVTIAVDPNLIPLGSTVIADYGDGILHYYRADDTGSGVRGRHIDLCMNSHQEALQAGLRTATIYVVEEG